MPPWSVSVYLYLHLMCDCVLTFLYLMCDCVLTFPPTSRPGGEDSFFGFMSRMMEQYMKEEEVRSRHRALLLQLREKALKVRDIPPWGHLVFTQTPAE